MFRFSGNVRVNRSTGTCLSEGGGGAWHFFRAAFITRARRRDRVAAAASCGSRDARREHVVYSLIKLGRNAYARTDILPASSSDCLENLLPRCLVLLIEFACRAASEAGDARWPRGAGAALCCECLLLPVPCAQCPVPGALCPGPSAQCTVPGHLSPDTYSIYTGHSTFTTRRCTQQASIYCSPFALNCITYSYTSYTPLIGV